MPDEIKPINVADELSKSFLDYSMSLTPGRTSSQNEALSSQVPSSVEPLSHAGSAAIAITAAKAVATREIQVELFRRIGLHPL